MSSNWTDLAGGKVVKRNIIRERLEQKKKERLDNSSGNLNLLETIKPEPEDSKLTVKQEPGISSNPSPLFYSLTNTLCQFQMPKSSCSPSSVNLNWNSPFPQRNSTTNSSRATN